MVGVLYPAHTRAGAQLGGPLQSLWPSSPSAAGETVLGTGHLGWPCSPGRALAHPCWGLGTRLCLEYFPWLLLTTPYNPHLAPRPGSWPTAAVAQPWLMCDWGRTGPLVSW